MNDKKFSIHPSAPTMEDIELGETEIAVAPTVATAVPDFYDANARPPATAYALPIPAPALPAYQIHSSCCTAAAATAPGVNIPVATATSPPQFTVSNEDYAKNMRMYSTQLRNRRVAVCIIMIGLFVVILVVGIVVATRQREAYNNSWTAGENRQLRVVSLQPSALANSK
jgi:hypothetical protein